MPAIHRFAAYSVRAGMLGLFLAVTAGDVRTQSTRLVTVAPRESAPVYRTLWIGRRAWTELELLKLAASANPYERQYAVLQLGERGDTSDPAVGAVATALGDPADIVRFQAMGSLLRLGPRAHPVLVDALRNERVVGSFHYYSAQRNFDVDRNLMVADLAFTVLRRQNNINTSTLVAAYASVARPPVARPSSETSLHERLGIAKGDEIVRRTPAERMLLLISQSRAQPAAALGPLLARDDAQSQWAALQALQDAPEVPAVLGPPLTRILTGGRLDLARLAAKVLTRVAPATLEEAALAPSPEVRAAAISGLASGRPLFVDRLSGALRDADPQVRLYAIDRAAEAFGIPAELTCARLRAEPNSARIASLAQPAAAMPASLFSAMLDEGRRMAGDELERWTAPLARITCLRPDLDSPLTSTLLSEARSANVERRAAALDALGKLADDGHIVAVDNWVPEAIGRLAATNLDREERVALARLLAAGTVRPETSRAVVDGYQRLLAQAGESAEKFLSALEHRPAAIARIYPAFMALMARRGVLTNGEAKIAIAGADPRGPLPEPLRQALTSWTGERAGHLVGLFGERPAADEVLLAAIDRVMRSGVANPFNLPRLGKTLAAAGARGVDRLAAIASDSRVSPAVRASAAESLGKFASTSASTPMVLMELANAAEPAVRTGALSGFGSPEYRGGTPTGLADTLRTAVRDPAREVRAAAVSAWVAHRLPVGGEVDRLVRDPDMEVRAGAMGMIALLPRADPRRAALLKEGVQDKQSHVRREALKAASSNGAAGAAVLAELLTTGAVDWAVLEAIEGLGSDAAPIVPKAIEMLSGAPAPESSIATNPRPSLLKVLGAVSPQVPGARRTLLEIATTGSDAERTLAAEALVQHGLDPWQVEPVLAAVLLDAAVRERMSALLAKILDNLYPYWGMIPVSGRLDSLPAFPWPPPAGHKWTIVPRTLPGVNVKTLGELYDSLLAALGRASTGFETGLFGGVPNGFAVVARMERIQTNGAPYPGDSRWVMQGMPFLSLSDFLGNLFFEKPGYFRVIALVATNDVNFSADPNAKLPSIGQGAREMPTEMRAKAFDTQSLLALIYTFERKPGAEITTWPDGAPSGTQHLTAAGLLGALQTR
jgi:hypothetical protein